MLLRAIRSITASHRHIRGVCSLYAIALCVCLLVYSLPGYAAQAPSPQKKWRIAYVEGGPFSDFQRVFQGLCLGLQDAGLIDDGHVPIPAKSESSLPMWQWLGLHAKGTHIEFVPDAHYSAQWDSGKRTTIRDEIVQRLNTKKDIDLILSFGTWAGQDLAKIETSVPIVISSVSNAVEAGIIPSADDSGKDNVTAPIEESRFKQQVRVFHDIFKFSTLGIAYEDTPSGRSSVALNDIESAAQELNVKLVRCTDTFDIQDTNLAADRLRQCHQKLAQQGAEAVYLTYNVGLQTATLPRVLEPLAQAFLPTFSQLGATEVAHGALLSISQANTTEEGRISGALTAAIIRGQKPRELNQRYESAVSLALNLRMSTLIGWNPPLEILAAVDEFYQEIQ